MKDFLGQELAVGDKVVSMRPRYRDLELLTIHSFTPKQVRLNRPGHYNYGGPDNTFLQWPSQMVKAPTT